MAKVTLTGDGKTPPISPVNLEVELQSDAIIRVSLCQGEMKVDLPGVRHVDIDHSIPDKDGKTFATITFGNGELKWIGPEPVIKE